ncbi:unnamed protein product [Trichobilharzia regenti]|nr:unnamed protein product [Trichobilharzia regenti]
MKFCNQSNPYKPTLEQLMLIIYFSSLLLLLLFFSLFLLGCSGFFKRSIHKNRTYTCKASGNLKGQCTIDRNRRNHCRACRLNKCFMAQMNEESRCLHITVIIIIISSLQQHISTLFCFLPQMTHSSFSTGIPLEQWPVLRAMSFDGLLVVSIGSWFVHFHSFLLLIFFLASHLMFSMENQPEAKNINDKD